MDQLRLIAPAFVGLLVAIGSLIYARWVARPPRVKLPAKVDEPSFSFEFSSTAAPGRLVTPVRSHPERAL